MIRYRAAILLVAAGCMAAPVGAPAQVIIHEPGTAPVAKPPAPKPEDDSPCAPLSRETSTTVARRLEAFETVFGKKAINWTSTDYDKVIALATACQGVRVGNGMVVHAPDWIASVNQARKQVLEISQIAQAVDDYARSLKPEQIKFPFCDKILDFTVDAYTQADNSAAIFGLSLMRMGDGDLDRVVKFTNYCITYLPAYATSARGWLKERTMDAVYKLMDRALLMQKRREEWAAMQRRPSDLVINVDGVDVPPVYASLPAREMVMRFNRATALQRRFTPETVSVLVKMSDEVLTKNASAYDKLYAEAVKQRLQDEIFRR